jgi:iron-sulfur cluster assembly protein
MRSRRPWRITRKSTGSNHGSHLERQGGKHVANYLTKRGKGVGLRLGVRTSGCSGMAYKLEFVDEVSPEDMVFESHGVKVLSTPRACLILKAWNSTYTREGLNEGFKFNNPERQVV